MRNAHRIDDVDIYRKSNRFPKNKAQKISNLNRPSSLCDLRSAGMNNLLRKPENLYLEVKFFIKFPQHSLNFNYVLWWEWILRKPSTEMTWQSSFSSCSNFNLMKVSTVLSLPGRERFTIFTADTNIKSTIQYVISNISLWTRPKPSTDRNWCNRTNS